MNRVFKIYVFRHGQTYFNEKKTFTGFKDSKLSTRGIAEAKIITRKLKNKKFQIVFQTHLSRSKDTLKEVMKFHPECYAIIEDDRMIERGYGKLEGKTHEKTIKKYGQEKYDAWHRGFRTRPPGGESFADVEKRVRSFIKDLIALIKKERVNVAISAHGNSIRLFRKIMEHASEKEACSWFIPYDKVFEYKIKA
ncbi:MAG: histidine phosphatase family protein [Candidatus Jorgensenbacteria bacterium]|nr:histidine phosphatase family protein [Candidatus Jorgensenbacteria bacterium]